jgi:hypothetical protein
LQAEALGSGLDAWPDLAGRSEVTVLAAVGDAESALSAVRSEQTDES